MCIKESFGQKFAHFFGGLNAIAFCYALYFFVILWCGKDPSSAYYSIVYPFGEILSKMNTFTILLFRGFCFFCILLFAYSIGASGALIEGLKERKSSELLYVLFAHVMWAFPILFLVVIGCATEYKWILILPMQLALFLTAEGVIIFCWYYSFRNDERIESDRRVRRQQIISALVNIVDSAGA